MVDQFVTRNANKSIKALPSNRGSLARIFAQVTLSSSFFESVFFESNLHIFEIKGRFFNLAENVQETCSDILYVLEKSDFEWS